MAKPILITKFEPNMYAWTFFPLEYAPNYKQIVKT